MNFPSTSPVGGSNHEFEVIVDEAIEPESASPAKPATEVFVIFVTALLEPREEARQVTPDQHGRVSSLGSPAGRRCLAVDTPV